MPSRVPAEVRENLERVRLLVLDVDGVLTDGSLIYSADGEEYKQFSVRDGLGIRLLLQAGVQVAIITGRASEAVRTRCEELGIRSDLIVLGSKDKGADLDRMESLLDIRDRLEIAAVKLVSDGALGKMAAGLPMMEIRTRPARVQRISARRFRMVLLEGKNRQVRRMVRKVGNQVTGLKRIRVANIKLGRLAPGAWRHLNDEEQRELLRIL